MRHQQKPEKAENFSENWKNLLNYIRSYWFALLVAVFLAAGGNILTVIAPARLGQMTNVISEGIESSMNLELITSIGLSLVVLYGLGGLSTLLQGWIMASVTQNISKQLRSDISLKISKLPMAYSSQTTVGDTLSRVTNDVDTIGRALNMSVQNLISSGTLLVGSLVMMFLTNWVLTVAAIASTLIGVILMVLIMRNSQKYFVAQQNHLGSINGLIEESYSGHTIVKAYNAEGIVRDEFLHMNDNLRESGFRAQALSSLMMPIMTFIGNLSYVTVSVLGAVLALNGYITFGVIVAFILFVRYFTQPLSQIAQAFQALQSAAAAGERVFNILEEPEMADESFKPAKIEQSEGRVEFSNVQFSYDKTKEPVIHDFSAKAEPGQIIAIVGHTGAGKTTIVNLLMRFYEIDKGEITIDGIAIKDIPKSNLHEQFCMVLQDTWVFEGSVRENLIYNTESVSDEKMIQATKAVGIHYFIQTLADGYDTVLNEQVNLSQGQKQQLTIARAIIADRPMLILDEATSSVDTRTEINIQKAMELLMEGRTTFVIAHRLSTIKNADLILVMDEGNIVESGTHDELMVQNGFYKDLYNSQFEQAS